jgi:hypothetical protein
LTRNKKPKPQPNEVDEGPVANPYGAFLRESKTQANIGVQLDIVVQHFKRGVLVTVLQGESRKFSQFFPHDEVRLEDAEEEESGVYSELDQW